MNPWQDQLDALGEFIRTQRKLANLSLRELAAMTDVSNAYLSQIERGLHEPSVRVLRSIAQALEISANTVLAQAGLVDGLRRLTADGGGDPFRSLLSAAQKEALLAVYRSYVREQESTAVGRRSSRATHRRAVDCDSTIWEMLGRNGCHVPSTGGHDRNRPERSDTMSESVYRVTEVIGVSPDSWEAAAQNAVTTAGQTIRDLRVAEATRFDVTIQDGKISSYRVRLDISFKYDKGD